MGEQQLSLLSGEEIKSSGLVDRGEDKLYRASTYDLSVGEIVLSDGLLCKDSSYPLPPGGMVRVISKESLRLPGSITGHVLLKNGLCTKGVLAINIGVVDPGFNGPISSTLINFGRELCSVEKGTPFLRVSFHRCLQSPQAELSATYTHESYVARVKQEVLAYSAATFLNMEKMSANAAEKVFAKFKDALLLWATVLAVLIALLAIFAPLGASFVEKYIVAGEERDARAEQALEKKFEERYESRLKALSDQLDQLRRANEQSKPEKGTETK